MQSSLPFSKLRSHRSAVVTFLFFIFFFGGLGFGLEFVSCHSSAGLSVRQSARIPSFRFWSFEAG